MALRDQPYLPLYVQDYLTDEKLNECCASTQGIYIKIMCIMHKSEEYGTILLEQKYKQTDNQIKNFALKLVKHLPFSEQEIFNALSELLQEKVIYLIEDKIYQKRMVNDNMISLKRSEAGQKGGQQTQFAKAKTKANGKAKHKANSENENEIVNENIINNLPIEEKIKTWREDFLIYQNELRKAWKEIITLEYVAEREKYHPKLDIKLTLEKSCKDFWSKEEGWKNKKASKSKKIDWEKTFNNALTQKQNQVWKSNQYSNIV